MYNILQIIVKFWHLNFYKKLVVMYIFMGDTILINITQILQWLSTIVSKNMINLLKKERRKPPKTWSSSKKIWKTQNSQKPPWTIKVFHCYFKIKNKRQKFFSKRKFSKGNLNISLNFLRVKSSGINIYEKEKELKVKRFSDKKNWIRWG